jgi:hypothetical protein
MPGKYGTSIPPRGPNNTFLIMLNSLILPDKPKLISIPNIFEKNFFYQFLNFHGEI